MVMSENKNKKQDRADKKKMTTERKEKHGKHTSLAGLQCSIMKIFVLHKSQRGEEWLEGETGTKGVGVAVTENRKVLPSPETPVLFNWHIY